MVRGSARIVAAAMVASMLTGVAGAQRQLVENWREMGPKQRYDALQHYWQHQQLPQERQRDVEQRYERWQNLPPDERDRIRQNYQRYQQLPPPERERFERKYKKWREQNDKAQ